MKLQQGKEAGLRLVACKECGEPMHFVATRKGRLMPCNQKKTTIITVLGDVVSGWEAHWATCPQAEKFIRRRRMEKKGRVQRAFELIREEAISRLTPSDYPGKLHDVLIELDRLLLVEMKEFREAERR